MKTSIKITSGTGFAEPELHVNHITKISDLFLVQVPETKNDIKKLEIHPVLFIANCTLVFNKKDTKQFLPEINRCFTTQEEVGRIDVICSFYINKKGALSVGTIAELPETLDYVDGDAPKILVDYGNHINWCKLAGEATPTLFQFAKKVLTEENCFTVEEGHFKVGFQ